MLLFRRLGSGVVRESSVSTAKFNFTDPQRPCSMCTGPLACIGTDIPQYGWSEVDQRSFFRISIVRTTLPNRIGQIDGFKHYVTLILRTESP